MDAMKTASQGKDLDIWVRVAVPFCKCGGVKIAIPHDCPTRWHKVGRKFFLEWKM